MFKGNNGSAFSNERIFANGAHTHGCLETALGRITMETICSTAGIQFGKSIFQDVLGVVKIKLERKFHFMLQQPPTVAPLQLRSFSNSQFSIKQPKAESFQKISIIQSRTLQPTGCKIFLSFPNSK